MYCLVTAQLGQKSPMTPALHIHCQVRQFRQLIGSWGLWVHVNVSVQIESSQRQLFFEISFLRTFSSWKKNKIAYKIIKKVNSMDVYSQFSISPFVSPLCTADHVFFYDRGIPYFLGKILVTPFCLWKKILPPPFFGQAKMSFLGKILVTPSWREKYRTLYWLGEYNRCVFPAGRWLLLSY